MSRSTHQRQQQKLQLQQQQQQLLAQQQQMAENDAAAAAAEMFDLFCVATTMRQVLGLHRNMCDLIGMRPAPLNEFYPKLKAKIRSWKAQALWKKFDARAAHRAYAKGNACTGTRVLVIGAGPCGLRTAIEAQLLGAKVVVVEKRDRISRNNVLHLWPFVITDLRNLGAKKFYGKFCAGSIDHISIRQLQCILLKVALLLGVEIHEGVSFDGTIEPSDGCGWRACVTPTDHAVSHYEFDVLIGADGKRNTLEGFKRKEFRGKLAIAITANFINKKTEAEAKAEEISGVAFIFNQSFFKELYQTTGIDLENIVYYKDETHYFVMTAKKHSLIDKGVIMHDFADPAELLAPANVNTEKLLDYAREAAEFSTKYQMPNLEFAVNHYGKPDVAMFDFTSMFAAETSCRVIMRKGFRLLQCLVGDSLLEPFWPTGSGCARGFLSSMDAAYAIKLWSNARNSTLGVLAQRESIYRLLNQTTPENLQRDIGSYTVDPATRYPNLNRTSVNVWQVKHLIDSDDPAILEQTFMDTNALQPTQVDTPVRRKRRSGDSLPLSAVLLRWICAQLHSYDFSKTLKEVSDVFTNGKVLCALINRYRPDLVDFNTVKDLSAVECNDIAFKTLEIELNIPRVMSGKDSVQLNAVESKLWLNYLEQICEVFRGEIPHVKHPKMDFTELREKYRFNTNVQPDFSKLLQISTKQKAKSPMQDMVDVPQPVRRSVLDEERLKRQRKHAAALDAAAADATGGQQGQADTPRRAKKRRSAEKAANIEERQKRLQEIEQNRQDRQSKRRQQRYQQTQNFYKSLHMLQANTLLRESDDTSPFEDYSIFLYRQQAPVFNERVKDLERKLLYPDRERCDIPSALPRNATDEQFSDRIKSMEQRITSRNTYGTEKKPKDLMRAIGKIDSSDWNVREIEKKIEQSKKTEIHGPKGREKVPKWSKEQFMARQHKMSKPIRQDSGEEKFKEIDQTLKNLDKQLKEGSVLEVGERGRNKVASIAGQFVKKDDTSDEKNPPTTVVQKPSTKVALAFKKQAASEKCHFCKQTVYLMEKINTEGLILHRSCLKCHHCHTNLRPGGYAFDRDDPNGRFYCTQHFRLPAKAIPPAVRKPGQRKPTQQQQAAAAAAAISIDEGTSFETPDKLRGRADSLAQLDLLDRGQTPERIEFENTDAMSDGEPSEEHIIDENEWSGRNFLPESNNDSESDLSSSDDSDSESDSDMFEEANDSPLGVQTLQLATDWIGKQNYSDSDDSDDFYDSSDGMADDGKDDTEGEEFKKARELRREEVRLLPLPANLPTDTETELKNNNENKENLETAKATKTETETSNEHPEIKAPVSINMETTDLGNLSTEALKSEQPLISDVPSGPTPATNKVVTTKADMEKIERNSERKFSAEIEEISEKLYRLNNMMKMTKDLESLAKENMVKSDILKKLTLKEKWLANNDAANINPVTPKSQFDLKVAKIFKSGTDTAEENKPKNETNIVEKINDVEVNKPTEENKPETEENIVEKINIIEANKPLEENKLKAEVNIVEKTNIVEANKPPEDLMNLRSKENNSANNMPPTIKAIKTSPKQSPITERRNLNLSRSNSLKKTQKHLSPSASPQMEKKTSAASSRSNSFKSASSASSPKLHQKSSNISLKKPESSSAALNESKMKLENILDIVRKIDISGSENQSKSFEKHHAESSDSDIGKQLYDAESKFSPKTNRTAMSTKLKEIESKSFAGTMDTIKSQLVMPTVSAQAAPSVDLSKYFPNQKQEKSNMSAVNKNQKNLKDVDLTKYFPSSPVQQKRTTVVTVAEKLKKSQTDAAIATSKQQLPAAATVSKTKVAPKRQASLGESAASSTFSLREHQLDGALDVAKKKSSLVTTTNATGISTKKGNVKIIKKIVPKGTKTKKTPEVVAAMEKINSQSPSIIPRDESDRILDEILHSDNEHKTRSPSFEYKKLFDEEKSPSEDISDKIEHILEETGIDLGLTNKQPNSDRKKKLLKAKSLGEGEFERNQNGKLTDAATGSLQSVNNDSNASGEPKISGVQNILKRFESLSSTKSCDSVGGAFKLQRMESSTSNLNKSRESLVSRESDSLSDLEKTMEYLKSEWRSEATNFLKKKRDNFYAEKSLIEKESKQLKKSEVVNELPVQYRESKLAKFFGIKQKSPEIKNTSLEKKKTSEKKKTPEKKKSPLRNKASPEKKTTSARKVTTEKKNSPEKKILPQSKALLHSTTVLSPKITEKREACKKPMENVMNFEEREIVTLLDLSQKNLKKPKETFVLQENGDYKSQEIDSKLLKTETHLPVLKPLPLNEITVIDKTAISSDSNEKRLLNHSSVKNTTELEPVATELERKPSLDQSPPRTPIENRRPPMEDIKNLPKFGCDKSQSNSRRNSQTSLQGRRLSDGSLADNVELIAVEKLANKVNTTQEDNHSLDVVDFSAMTKQLEGATEKVSLVNNGHESSRSYSKSSSAQPVTVKLRGSSEEESIEKLFCQFSDDMLVDVEFDSNDDLIAITPRAVLINNVEQIEADKDHLDRLESLEKDTEIAPSAIASITTGIPSFAVNLEPKSLLNLDESQFPTRPQRRQKSSSSSSEPSVPLVPHRMKKKLEKLNPTDMAPSVQDLMHDVFSKHIDNLQYVPVTEATPLKFPHKFEEDFVCTEITKEQNKLNSTKVDLKKTEDTAGNGPIKRHPSKSSIKNEVAVEVLPESKDTKEDSLKNMEQQPAEMENKDYKDAPKTLDNNRRLSMQNINTNTPLISLAHLTQERSICLEQENIKSEKQGMNSEELNPILADSQTLSEVNQQLKLQIFDISARSEKLKISNNNGFSDKDKNTQKADLLITPPNLTPAQSNSNRSSTPPMFKKHEIPSESLQSSTKIESQESSLANMEKQSPKYQRRLSGDTLDGFTDTEARKAFNADRRLSTQNAKEENSTLFTITNLSPAQSIKFDQSSIGSNRSGTPPMFKKLEIMSDSKSTPQASRRNSAASALSEVASLLNLQPIYAAPMPKKLQIPMAVPQADNNDNEPIAEVFKNRSWPNPYADKPEHCTSFEDDNISDLIIKEKQIPTDDNSTAPSEKLISPNENRLSSSLGENTSKSDFPTKVSGNIIANELENDQISDTLMSKRRHSNGSIGSSSEPTSQFRKLDALNVNAVNIGSASKEKSLDWDMEKMPASPMPRRKFVHDFKPSRLRHSSDSINSKNDVSENSAAEPQKLSVPVLNATITAAGSKAQSKESLDWDMEKMPASPMPRHKFVHAERSPYQETNLRDISPTSSLKILNNLPQNNESVEDKEKRLIENFESERRQALTKRDKEYAEKHKSLKLSNPRRRNSDQESISLGETPLMSTANSSTAGSIKSDHVQSDSESSSSDKVEQNSATEISTDSEFDHDEIIRETPKIFIDDTHLRKPTKVQVKSTPTIGQKYNTAAPSAAAAAQTKGGSYLQKYQTHHEPIQPQFKPLVQVDPSVLSTNRLPLQNPRLGDYQLNKTASTEGIASKKSLELKKRYLLGEPANGNKIQKSGSTSVLDSKIRSFHSNISECQKLLNPGSDISPSMKTFLDRTKLGEHTSNDTTNIINRQAGTTTGNILNDLKVEITIQKASSTASTDNEKENIFVNSKNELNKGMEYSETVNTALVETLSKKSVTAPTPNNNHPTIIETIDLVTPEKKPPAIIDLTQVEIPAKMLESNVEFINNIAIDNKHNLTQLPHIADSNKIIDLTSDSPVKNESIVIDDSKPDVSRGVKESIPDIIEGIETTAVDIKQSAVSSPLSGDEQQHLLSNNSYDEEKKDSPEKHQQRNEIDENNDLQIQVPNIPWNTRKPKNCSSISGSSCTSSNTSSIEDIQHYILDSTTSPDTQTAAACIGQVPRLEVHDTAGELMQIDSLMIIDGKYIGDPEDLKLMDIPAGLIIPAFPEVKTTEVDDEPDIEPVTATPEPADRTVIETVNDLEPPPLPEHGPPLPAQGPPKMRPAEFKFDTRNENKVESLKNLPLIVDQVNDEQQHKVIKPITLNLSMAQKSQKSTTPTTVAPAKTPLSPLTDNDKTPTAELLSRGSDSETEATGTGTGTGQVLTETELSDWTADDCISENFIDIEFVLNSNKGTIKRNKNKKGKKKHSSIASKLLSAKESLEECSTKIAPVAEFEGILQNLDIDEIEFMDTGSEGSCAEAYSATNTALLRNRGYIEFIETNTPKTTPSTTSKTTSETTIQPKSTSEKKLAEIITKRDEVLGIDYIEQGAYIMQRDDSQQDLLKTPVNEEPQAGSVEKFKVLPPINPLLSQSLTDSITLNEDDSLGIITPNSQAQLTTSNSGKTYTKTTTEESEALTVVTSPLDSSSPKLRELIGANAISNSNNTGSTPSSSEKNPKTSLSTCTPCSTSTASSSNVTSPRRNSSQEVVSSGKISTTTASPNIGPQRNTTDELSYEEYVRALQQKITQISSARGDSFDSRKQRRKSSKGEAPIMTFSSDTQTVIEQSTNQRGNSSQSQAPPLSKQEVKGASSALTELRETAQAHKVPEIPTLSRRLEEITKERTKQKDLIHDLVMDKLQSKKQLNAEKRLHRSRQRTMLTSGMSGYGITGSISGAACGYTSGSSLSPTPKLAAAATTTDTNCTNQAHYHVSTASNIVQPVLATSSGSFKENTPLQKSATYVAAYHKDAALSPTRTAVFKQRPFSEHLDAEQLDALESYKLTKTPSYSYIMSTSKRNINNQPKTLKDENSIFNTPAAPLRSNRNHIALSPTTVCNPVVSATASTDKLRSEARARARLKSNNELGLSPEEKMLLLRKRLNIDDQQQYCHIGSPEKLEAVHVNARDRKMSTSKSVNDLATVSHFGSQLQSNSSANENVDTTQKSPIIADFTSDPNLLLSSAQTTAKLPKEKSTLSRRQKDPERRKSIIQSLSSFFHMGNSGSNNNGGSNKKDSTSNIDANASAGHSAQPERPGTNGSSTTSGSVDGVFSRFRISSKTKEKSKENGSPTNAATSSTTAPTEKTGTKTHYERSSSQDCILNSKNSNIKHHTHSHHHNNNNIKKPSTASAYSSSSPQLFVTKSFAHNAAADDQTPPPIPPLPLHYQRSDDESYATETREQKKQRSISKAIRQAELKRLRIAQEIQREQEEIEVQLKELEARGVLIEKALRGESHQVVETLESTNMGASDEKLLKELLDIWRNITQLKKRDEELGIRQQELQLEHRHAQLKEELNIRLSNNKLDKSSADVAAEGAILNEMLEIVAKRAALRPTVTPTEMEANINHASAAVCGNLNMGMIAATPTTRTDSINLLTHGQSYENNESNI